MLLTVKVAEKQGHLAFQIYWKTIADLPVLMDSINELNQTRHMAYLCAVQGQSGGFYMSTPTVRAWIIQGDLQHFSSSKYSHNRCVFWFYFELLSLGIM